MDKYFICDGNKYIIDDDKIYEIFENQHIIPTSKELRKVKKMIKNIDQDIFNSSKLNEIAKRNKELYKIDVLPEILGKMEKVIGDEYIESFYKNLETVRFEFDDPVECDDKSLKENGYHDSMSNVIHINAETVDCLRKFSIDNNLDFELVFKIALAHELFHLASCDNQFATTGIIYQGLTERDFNKRYSDLTTTINFGKAKAFNEGLTQLLACGLYAEELGDHNFHKFNNTYTEEARVICQIAEMVGHKNIKKAYFKNLGMGYIKDKIYEINNSKKLYDSFTTNMGRLINYDLDETVRNSSAIKIQNILLQYESNYLEIMNKDKTKEFINSVNYYFIGNWKDEINNTLSPESKLLLEENLKLFDNLKEKQKTYSK